MDSDTVRDDRPRIHGPPDAGRPVQAAQRGEHLVRLGDRVFVTSEIAHFGKSSFRFEHRIEYPDGQLAVKAVVVMVCVGDEARPVAIPEELLAKLDA